TEVYIFGTSLDKLSYFSFADGTFLVNEIPKGFLVDHAFECVGGNGSTVAIEQIIETVMPEATVSILGVSEYPIPINTRMILEKGLRFFGTSRSGIRDFEKTIEIYEKYPEIVDYLGSIVSSVNPVSTIDDIIDAFERDAKKAFGKTIMKWEE
ncbi:MAG: ribitol-5-phosphate dehydrogenase, partial [Eubacterium sp.]|nr:ribitol-5-phosphate dehydrogenase [Eubacterium sp.]